MMEQYKKQDFQSGTKLGYCDYCNIAGQLEAALYTTDIPVEGVGYVQFETPRPVRLCDQCYDNLPK